MEFWAVEVKPGITVSCKAVDGFVFHLTQAALGATKEGAENVVLSVKVGEKNLVLGTLSADLHPQIIFDLIFNENFKLWHSSKTTSVFFSGQKTTGSLDYEEMEPVEIPLKNSGTGSSMSRVDLRQLATSNVVLISSAVVRPTVEEPNAYFFSYGTGVILVAESNFCFIMFKRAFVEKGTYFAIKLPDGSPVSVKKSRFVMPPKCAERGMLVGCFVYQADIKYDSKKTKAVDFGEVVERFEEVYLCDPSGY